MKMLEQHIQLMDHAAISLRPPSTKGHGALLTVTDLFRNLLQGARAESQVTESHSAYRSPHNRHATVSSPVFSTPTWDNGNNLFSRAHTVSDTITFAGIVFSQC